MAVITGNNLKNKLVGTAGSDVINGLGGNDVLMGGAGSDTLNGGTGNDTLDGGSGFNVLNGGTGNDILYGHGGVNAFNGGAGTDTVDFSKAKDGVDSILGAGKGLILWLDQDTILGLCEGDTFSSIDTIVGSPFDDNGRLGGGASKFFGGAGNDTLNGSGLVSSTISGGSGDDFLSLTVVGGTAVGGAGRDTLSGGPGGTSILIGGTGTDTLNGGAGVDRFVLSGHDNDQIVGFAQFADKLQIDGDEFGIGARLGVAELVNGSGPIGIGPQFRYQNFGNGFAQLTFDFDGTGGAFHSVTIATFSGSPPATLGIADFIVV